MAAQSGESREAPARRSTPPADIPGLTTRLRDLETELRHTWNIMLELDAATAGRLSHAGRLVHRANLVLSDHNTIF